MHEIKHRDTGIRHHGKDYWWDGRAVSLCEKSFPHKTYKEPLVYSGVTCAECKDAKRQGKRI